jgi:catechol 2,3-dioxygenase-like lactoylglutathione lyase family enzyme
MGRAFTGDLPVTQMTVLPSLHAAPTLGANLSSHTVMVTKLLHTRYRVNDLDKTVSFYKEVLGLEEVKRHKSPRGSELVFFRTPNSDELIEICAFPASGPVQLGPSRLRTVDILVEPSESHARPDSQEPGRSMVPVDPLASPTQPRRGQGSPTDDERNAPPTRRC